MASLNRRRYREQLAGESYTQAEWQEVLDKYGSKCLKCGATENITIDHVIPISRGGDNTRTNLQPLCRKCNRNKSNNIADYRNDPDMTTVLMHNRWRIVLARLGYKLDEPERTLSDFEKTFLASLDTSVKNVDSTQILAFWQSVFDWFEEQLQNVPQLLAWFMMLLLRETIAMRREQQMLRTFDNLRANVGNEVNHMLAELGGIMISPFDALAEVSIVGDLCMTNREIQRLESQVPHG